MSTKLRSKKRQHHRSRNQYQDKLLSRSIGIAYTVVDRFLNNGGGIPRANLGCSESMVIGIGGSLNVRLHHDLTILNSVYCLDFDSSRIISGSRDRTIKVWCIKTGKCVASFEGHTGSVLCLKFERDWDLGSDGVCRGFMVSGSSDCTVCVWDLVSTPVGPGEMNRVSYAGGSRPGKSRDSYATAVTGSFGPPRKISAEIRKVLRGHSGGVLDLRMDEKWIVSW